MSTAGDVYDVIVLGGGPAGLMAAAVASQRGKRVLLIEKNGDIGKKLSITGGGRCNILNAEADTRTLLSHYGEADKFLFAPFARFDMQDTWDFFTMNGLPLAVEAGKRTFPESRSATDVVRFFRRLLESYGVTVRCSTRVTALLWEGNTITGVVTNQGTYKANAYILATGGLSHPETGSTGDGLMWLNQLGHTVVRPNPSLVPLVAAESWVQGLAGVSVSNTRVMFTSAPREGLAHKPVEAIGRILFTHFGLSGPAILNASASVQELLKDGSVQACIDVTHGRSLETLEADLLAVFSQHKNKVLKNVLKYLVPPGMSSAVAQQLPAAIVETPVHSITREARRMLAAQLKNLTCTITGTKGNDWAIVSDGGVPLTEIDTKTMRSQHMSNLHIVGDVLHIRRPSGGYSLQLCWTTGAVAGMSV